MKKQAIRSAFILTLLLVCRNGVYACDCITNGRFLEAAHKSDLIALVKVTKYLKYIDSNTYNSPLSMEVEIIDKYAGSELNKKIIVFGDNGMMCRPYLSEFKEGEYYIIAFNSIKNSLASNSSTEYEISICGEYWLSVDKHLEFASGDIIEGHDKMTLSELKAKLNE